MYTVLQTERFERWLDGIRDPPSKARLLLRLKKAERGSFGDCAPVGDGVFEMREHFGPGWRMYYLRRGEYVVLMLGGGNKGSQGRDIATAREMAKVLRDDEEN